jgi:CheY-like chemotaxis protein
MEGNETILLVEDDALLRRVMSRILTSEGYRVICAEDGEVALELWAKHRGEVNLVISDSVMPKINGLGLFTTVMSGRALGEAPPLPFLFCSGYPERHVGYHQIHGPGRSFLLKPFETSTLRSEVRRLLNEAKDVESRPPLAMLAADVGISASGSARSLADDDCRRS